MLQAEELRIGNLFYPVDLSHPVRLPQTGLFFKVLEVQTFGVMAIMHDLNPVMEPQWIRFGYRELSPIPLTPEILEAAGFLPLAEIPGCYSIINMLTEIRINNSKGFATVIKPSFSEERVVAVPGDIKYLHQLQNLYFALTGNELNIKLNNHTFRSASEPSSL